MAESLCLHEPWNKGHQDRKAQVEIPGSFLSHHNNHSEDISCSVRESEIEITTKALQHASVVFLIIFIYLNTIFTLKADRCFLENNTDC